MDSHEQVLLLSLLWLHLKQNLCKVFYCFAEFLSKCLMSASTKWESQFHNCHMFKLYSLYRICGIITVYYIFTGVTHNPRVIMFTDNKYSQQYWLNWNFWIVLYSRPKDQGEKKKWKEKRKKKGKDRCILTSFLAYFLAEYNITNVTYEVWL